MKCPNCKQQATSFKTYLIKSSFSKKNLSCNNCGEKLNPQAFPGINNFYLGLIAGLLGAFLSRNIEYNVFQHEAMNTFLLGLPTVFAIILALAFLTWLFKTHEAA